jgi:predicted HicB family RNase H-like nuclease
MAKTRTAKERSEPAFRPEEYSYNVAWSQEDDAFVGRVMEFPSLAAHGRTQETALREVRKVVAYVLDDLTEQSSEIPVPLGRREYSGRLNVRMPKELHRRLAAESAAEGVSLNTLINTKLAH